MVQLTPHSCHRMLTAKAPRERWTSLCNLSFGRLQTYGSDPSLQLIGQTRGLSGASFVLSGSGGSTVDCWGYSGDGELGNGTTTSSSGPVAVVDLP